MTDWENEVDPNRLNAVEGDTEQDDISLGCTTSCSSDSFEVSSSAPASSISNDKMLTISNNHQGGLIEKTFEKSREEIRPTTRQNPFLSEDTVSLIDLDTRMPTFDFERLEKQLKTAIEEQENKDKLVRRMNRLQTLLLSETETNAKLIMIIADEWSSA